MPGQTPQQAYETLKDKFDRMSALSQASSILSKDAELHMPPGGETARIKQRVAISDSIQDLISDPALGDMLDIAESGAQDFSPEDRRNLELMRHSWIHEASLPADRPVEHFVARIVPHHPQARIPLEDQHILWHH